jgi:hypothetical protein
MLQAADLLLASGVTWSLDELRLAILSACYGWANTDVSLLSAFLRRCAPLLSTALASCSDSESSAVSSLASSGLRAHWRAANPLLASLCSPSGATLPVVQLLVDAIGDSDSELFELVNSPVFSYDWNAIVGQALSLVTPTAVMSTSSLIHILCGGAERAGTVLSQGVLTLACARVAPAAFVHLFASQARVGGLSGEAAANTAVATLRFDTLAALQVVSASCCPTDAAFHLIAHAASESFVDCRLPLVVAIRGRHGAIVDKLLDCGVDVRACDGVGDNARDCVLDALEELRVQSAVRVSHAGGRGGSESMSIESDLAVFTAALARVQRLLAVSHESAGVF